MEFINESGLEFDDISSEDERTYVFADGVEVKIRRPLKLNVSKSGGHRIYDAQNQSHYIPSGWIHLMWISQKGKPNFVK